MEPNLYDRVRLAREGSAVERAHAHPHLMRYSVGHHSNDLVSLIVLAWQADHGGALPRAELLVAANFHDHPERITGDLPKPIKDLVGTFLEAVDDCVLEWMGVRYDLTTEEARYLEAGDRLELWLWSWEEAHRGNRRFLSWVTHYDSHFRAFPPPPAYQRILERVRLGRGVNPLEQADLMEIACL